MKRERDSFFESSNFQMSAMGPNMMNQGMPNMNAASTNFYAMQGNGIPNPNAFFNNSSISELESRMAKLERNMNRLEARMNQLEGTTYYSKDVSDGNMYMV